MKTYRGFESLSLRHSHPHDETPVSKLSYDAITSLDRRYLWHPYSALSPQQINYPVASAQGCTLKLADGRELVDGMASWWCAIHGYNVPELNTAVTEQLDDMAHVMFGGLTHQPAALLAEKLVSITPENLQSVFFSDSGSVSVEVAMKMAMQYWHSKGHPHKQKFATVRNGYHGDTFAAMSVCDPVTGMHSLFNDTLTPQFFAERPACRFGESCDGDDILSLKTILQAHADEIAAVIIEPVVQGAGGMWFYSADYLKQLRALCDQHNVLLILDEIATGFGRTGKLFACEHAGIAPDIMCVGKSLTGGYMTLAATLSSSEISQSISQGEPGIFMHGPTFMANPLACHVALRSIELLLSSPWQDRIDAIEQQLRRELATCETSPQVQDVRILGATGVVEMKQAVDMHRLQRRFVELGVWIRPFGKLIYLMPPYIISSEQLSRLTAAIHSVVKDF